MKFQVNTGWAIGQFLIPSSTIIDLNGKADHELTEWERLARGKIPPIDSCALDWDAAATMYRKYGEEFRHRLGRRLSAYDEDVFQQIIAGALYVG